MMNIENEIEKLTQRITSLKLQNNRFQSLLDSAVDLRKQATSQTQIQDDETEYRLESIRSTNVEKHQLQDDPIGSKTFDKEDLVYLVKYLKQENAALKNKVQVILLESEKNSRDLTQLKLEHGEFKFLLTQPDSNVDWLKNILLIDNTLIENASVHLMEQRYQLQQKVYMLERKKIELLNAIDDSAATNSIRDLTASKTIIENILYPTIDDATKKEYENLHVKISKLEEERSNLLCQLQFILDHSKKEIADGYYQLQKNLLEIELEKTKPRNYVTEKNIATEISQNMSTQVNLMEADIIAKNNENEKIENVLNAFTNPEAKNPFKSLKKKRPQTVGAKGNDFCTIC